MNKKFLKFGLGVILVGSFAITSCEDTTGEDINDTLTDLTIGCTDVNANNFSATAVDDDGSCEYDNDHYLTSDRWNFDNAVTTAGDSVTAMYNMFMVGMYFDYNDDNTFSGVVPGDNGLDTIDGTWSFMSSETMLALYMSDDTMVFGITELTADALGISFTEEEDSTNYDVTLNFVN